MTEEKKPGKKRQKPTKELRDLKVRTLAASGKTNVEIAEEVGVHRTTIQKILSSEETKALLREADSFLKDAIPKAARVIVEGLESPDENIRQKSAVLLLKNHGLLRESVDLNHNFPKPTVIMRPNGTQVILGVSEENED